MQLVMPWLTLKVVCCFFFCRSAQFGSKIVRIEPLQKLLAGKIQWWGYAAVKCTFEAVWLEEIFAHIGLLWIFPLLIFHFSWQSGIFSSSLAMLCKFYDPQTFVDSKNEKNCSLPCLLKRPNALHCSLFAEEKSACPLEVHSHHKERWFRLLWMCAHRVGGHAAVKLVK